MLEVPGGTFRKRLGAIWRSMTKPSRTTVSQGLCLRTIKAVHGNIWKLSPNFLNPSLVSQREWSIRILQISDLTPESYSTSFRVVRQFTAVGFELRSRVQDSATT